MGIAYSRNRGDEAVSGEFISFMDDDIAPLNRLELEGGFLTKNIIYHKKIRWITIMKLKPLVVNGFPGILSVRRCAMYERT